MSVNPHTTASRPLKMSLRNFVISIEQRITAAKIWRRPLLKNWRGTARMFMGTRACGLIGK